MAERLVVIGAGMASGRVLDELFARAPGAHEVTLFGAEPRGNYNRIMLSPVLAGEKTFGEIVTHDAAWYARHGVSCRLGEPVIAIDRARKTVISGGEAAEGVPCETPYDRLLIATGSQPFILPAPGADLPGVLSYRDLDDVDAMLAAAQKGGRAVVIGGGLLGLEAAAGLRLQGMDVTVLHLMPHLMERQLDREAALLLQAALEERGVEVLCGADTAAILGEERAEAVALKDGRRIDADLVVMAVGIRPNTQLAREAGLKVGRGVVVDDAMVTSDPAILAVGECVEHRGLCYGLVAPLYEMAAVAAQTLSGETAAYEGSVTATKLKVTGVDLFSAGDFAPGEDREEIILRDPDRGVYKRLVLQDNRLIGAVLYGDTGDGAWYFGQLLDGADLSDLREALIFGPAFVEAPPVDPMEAAAASPVKARRSGHLQRHGGRRSPRSAHRPPSPRVTQREPGHATEHAQNRAA
ncbi:MAG: FAD-dependent oxidoreductase [Pseudomonadota bacterium]